MAYEEDILRRYLTSTPTNIDPYQTTPFAEEELEQPVQQEDPFRFTEYGLNPAKMATTGMSARTPEPRSPFTSGMYARQLGDLRGQQSEFKEYEFKNGLPVAKFSVPESVFTGYQNPMYEALLWRQQNQNLTPEQLEKLGPMKELEGYDLEALFGKDAYAKAMAAQNPNYEQNLIRNLSLMPSSVNPKLKDPYAVSQLAARDMMKLAGFGNPFTTPKLGTDSALRTEGPDVGTPQFNGLTYPGTQQNFNEVVGTESLGEGETREIRLGETLGLQPNENGEYNPEFTQLSPEYFTKGMSSYLREHSQGGLRGLANKYMPMAINLGAMGVIGAASGGTLGPMIGSALGMGAGGLGAAAGLTGTGAALLNAGAGAAGAMGLNYGLSAAGVPMEHPLAKMLSTVAGGAFAGAQAGGVSTGGTSGGMGETALSGTRAIQAGLPANVGTQLAVGTPAAMQSAAGALSAAPATTSLLQAGKTGALKLGSAIAESVGEPTMPAPDNPFSNYLSSMSRSYQSAQSALSAQRGEIESRLMAEYLKNYSGEPQTGGIQSLIL